MTLPPPHQCVLGGAADTLALMPPPTLTLPRRLRASHHHHQHHLTHASSTPYTLHLHHPTPQSPHSPPPLPPCWTFSILRQTSFTFLFNLLHPDIMPPTSCTSLPSFPSLPLLSTMLLHLLHPDPAFLFHPATLPLF